MPAATNGSTGNGGPSVASRNGGSSFINGKGNASAWGNNIAQTNDDGTIVTEQQMTSANGNCQAAANGTGHAAANGNWQSAANGNGTTNLNGNGNAHLSDGTKLGRAEEVDDVSPSCQLLLERSYVSIFS
jgi:hypothetical protein